MSSVQRAPGDDDPVTPDDDVLEPAAETSAETPPEDVTSLDAQSTSDANRKGRANGLVEVRHWPIPVLMLVDVAILVVILVLLAMSRYEQKASIVNREGLGLALLLGACVYLATYSMLVARRCRWGTQDEVVGLAVVAIFLMSSMSAASILTHPAMLPLSVAVTAAPCAACGWLVLRYVAVQYHRARKRRQGRAGRRALVVGAGWGGRQAIAMMLDDAGSVLHPVGLVDDDSGKRHLGISGIRVQGRIEDLPELARRLGAEVVLLAVPSASPGLVQRVIDLTNQAGADLLVLPSLDEMLSTQGVSGPTREGIPGGVRIDLPRQAFRPVLLDDLLGRGAVEIDAEAIASYLRDKVVLVTGAGGSIGSQLCREIVQYQPARLVMTDRDDSLLHAVQLSVDGRGMLDSEDLVLGDLRTPGFISDLIGRHRPDVVFHAAAVKHLTLAERYASEAFLTNVAATSDLLATCVEQGVSRFVNISTDKAADPASVLGFSKRITERLTASFGVKAGPSARYISVRFGNVLGSRGSALTTFAAQLAAGRPLTITSAEMTRYFMTVHEASQLVLQAAVHGRSGEGLILDMGKPHNIEQLARRFAALQGFPPPTVVYTGVRPGEKMTERTLASDEPDHRPFHDLVTHVGMPLMPDDVLVDIDRVRRELGLGRFIDLHAWLKVVAYAAEPVSLSPGSVSSGRA
ncbi:polysaccharide biosynthesis protein [Pedococcus aerophilus]|uniref:polysaccharide biosynthesis protein n=1 Tax=Pedococcus aerophilus TaxID=436356 RepID=UPI0031D44C54